MTERSYDMNHGLTIEGNRFVSEWVSAVVHSRHAKERYDASVSSVARAEETLAKWLLPDDAQNGEVIAVWYGDSLIAASVSKVVDTPIYRITVRQRGRSISEKGL